MRANLRVTGNSAGDGPLLVCSLCDQPANLARRTEPFLCTVHWVYAMRRELLDMRREEDATRLAARTRSGIG